MGCILGEPRFQPSEFFSRDLAGDETHDPLLRGLRHVRFRSAAGRIVVIRRFSHDALGEKVDRVLPPSDWKWDKREHIFILRRRMGREVPWQEVRTPISKIPNF